MGWLCSRLPSLEEMDICSSHRHRLLTQPYCCCPRALKRPCTAHQSHWWPLAPQPNGRVAYSTCLPHLIPFFLLHKYSGPASRPPHFGFHLTSGYSILIPIKIPLLLLCFWSTAHFSLCRLSVVIWSTPTWLPQRNLKFSPGKTTQIPKGQ